MLNKENLTDANIFSWYKFANLYKKYNFLPQNHILKLDEIMEISGSDTGIWKHENSMVIVSEKCGSWNVHSVTSEWSWLKLFEVKFGASSSDTKHISEDTVKHCLRTNRVRHSTQDCCCCFSTSLVSSSLNRNRILSNVVGIRQCASILIKQTITEFP